MNDDVSLSITINKWRDPYNRPNEPITYEDDMLEIARDDIIKISDIKDTLKSAYSYITNETEYNELYEISCYSAEDEYSYFNENMLCTIEELLELSDIVLISEITLLFKKDCYFSKQQII